MRLLNETKTVKIKDAEFTIGIIDRRKFFPIKIRFCQGTLGLTNITKEELTTLSPTELSKKMTADMSPEEILKREDMTFSAQWDLVKYGVKAHVGCRDAEGKEILLAKDDGGCVADETLNLYELNNFLALLANDIFAFNTLSETQKKNS